MKKNMKGLKFGGDGLYIILMYDIITDEESPKVHRNVFKICKKYLTNVQKSVFEGNLSELKLRELKFELEKYIRDGKDSLIIFKSRNERWLEKDMLGVVEDKTSRFF